MNPLYAADALNSAEHCLAAEGIKVVVDWELDATPRLGYYGEASGLLAGARINEESDTGVEVRFKVTTSDVFRALVGAHSRLWFLLKYTIPGQEGPSNGTVRDLATG